MAYSNFKPTIWSQFIQTELEILKIDHRIAAQVKKAAERNQKDFVLREQMKAIKNELGETDESEVEGYRARMEEKEYPEAVREKLEKEIRRLESLPRGSHEQPMAQAYIE